MPISTNKQIAYRLAGLLSIKTTFVKIRILTIPRPKKILIAPLDWGMGHTTRCMPIIGHLLEKGQRPLFAGNAAQCAIINEAYGKEVPCLHLDGYNITYSPLNRMAQAGLLLQMPRVLRTIRQEHQWLQQAVRDNGIDGIISDNRYGLHHSGVPSVIMTHQLHILSGMGGAIDGMVQRMHYRHLQRFGAVWVVDTNGDNSLAVRLSHPVSTPPNTYYMGLLSRFAGNENTERTPTGELLILLSGPEPQRSILSQILWQQALRYDGCVVFAEGSDKAAVPVSIPPNIMWHQRLSGAALEEALRKARLVVCRSGYSTLMDLAALGKRAILIPTPGQTEQEYLGRRMQELDIHHTASQAGFDLASSIQVAERLSGDVAIPQAAFTTYRNVVDDWLASLP